MISTFFAGLSLLLFLGVINTCTSYFFFMDIQSQTGNNNS